MSALRNDIGKVESYKEHLEEEAMLMKHLYKFLSVLERSGGETLSSEQANNASLLMSKLVDTGMVDSVNGNYSISQHTKDLIAALPEPQKERGSLAI